MDTVDHDPHVEREALRFMLWREGQLTERIRSHA